MDNNNDNPDTSKEPEKKSRLKKVGAFLGKITGNGFTRFILLLTLIIAIGYGWDSLIKESQHNRRIANQQTIHKYVLSYTRNNISPHTHIVIRFRHAVEEKLKKLYPLDELLMFSPHIEGQALWKDGKTIVFKPSTTLKTDKTYIARFKIKKLFKQSPLEILKWDFYVIPQKIHYIKEYIKLKNPQKLNLLIYQGTIQFRHKINLTDIEAGVALEQISKKIQLFWTQIDDNTFSFTSESIDIFKDKSPLILYVSKETFDLKQSTRKRTNISQYYEMNVVKVTPLIDKREKFVEIEFSQPLDSTQDISGLIETNPKVALKTSISNKKIILTGKFVQGQSYQLKISTGIQNTIQGKLAKAYNQSFLFGHDKPQITFSHRGVFLPSTNNKAIRFKSINVKKVNVEIKKIYENNYCQFLQTEKLDSKKKRNKEFDNYYTNRVGTIVFNQKIELKYEKNQWIENELDLSPLLQKHKNGIYLLYIKFNAQDMDYKHRFTRPKYYGNEPGSWSYMKNNAQIYKPITISNIGLTCIRGDKKLHIYATDLRTGKPKSNVKITLLTYQNQIIQSGYTNESGQILLNNSAPFLILGEKNNQVSILKPNEMTWNVSTFDTSGISGDAQPIRAFIYTERGVYRPGDDINVSIIARNQSNTWPPNHPITLKLYNPQNQLVKEFKTANSRDGFYNFNIKTKLADMTGKWEAQVDIGSKRFHKEIKLETIVPNRLKIRINLETPTMRYQDTVLNFDLATTYLFGAPASNLKSEAAVEIKNHIKTFPAYKGFTFKDETINFKPIINKVFEGTLDKTGKTAIRWELPPVTKVPSALTIMIYASTYEKGGRKTSKTELVSMDPYPFYIGIKAPDRKYHYYNKGDTLKFKTIALDKDGKPVAGQKLVYKIYRNHRYWWWEYHQRQKRKLKYKTDFHTELIKSGTLVSTKKPLEIVYTPDKSAEYLIEVSTENDRNHSCSQFFSVSYWGDTANNANNANTLALITNKEKYHPGNTAHIECPTPKNAQLLVSVLKGNKVIKSFWQPTSTTRSTTKIQIPITHQLAPNFYVSVSLIQPHNQTMNDRPIRLYGIIPIIVENPKTRLDLTVKTPEKLESNQAFEVEIQTNNKKQAQFTIAVVDEGLLSLTDYRLPNAWKHFYRKQRLTVWMYDLFDYVINANQGDAFQVFSIGGGLGNYREDQQSTVKVKRFKPVSLFKGPISTNKTGYAKVKFKLPEYIGAVRVMVIATKGKAYGRHEKSIPVRSDLMLLPSIPRVLAPNDEFKLPVTVFNFNEKIKKVEINVWTEGPIEKLGETYKELHFDKPGDQDVLFSLKTPLKIGKAKIHIQAKAGNKTVKTTTDIAVRPISPRMQSSSTQSLDSEKSIRFEIPKEGIPGTKELSLIINRFNIDLQHRLGWLIRYPYGCIEQTTSSVFPQLYLPKISKLSAQDQVDIDRNINAGIERLTTFQTFSGGFAYWPGQQHANKWGTNYAGHFLVEAKKRGYHIPVDLWKNWLYFQKRIALNNNKKEHLTSRVYRLYLLAKAGEAEIGSMNLLKENRLHTMNDTQKWLLAAAYYLAGNEEIAHSIADHCKTEVIDYVELSNTYGSTLRDQAIILSSSNLLQKKEIADRMYTLIAKKISSKKWYSTQTLGYSFIALGEYFSKNKNNEAEVIIGHIIMPNGKKEDYRFESNQKTFKLDPNSGTNLEISLSEKSAYKKVWVTLAHSFVPKTPTDTNLSKKIRLEVNWLNDEGAKIDPSKIKQGTTFWGHFRVNKDSGTPKLEELALVQVLPSGWEIENTRLNNKARPDWVVGYTLNKEEYLDIRDDRIMWFFDLNYGSYDFFVKLNAITVGKFTLAPTLCEAMYDNAYKAIRKGATVEVVEETQP